MAAERDDDADERQGGEERRPGRNGRSPEPVSGARVGRPRRKRDDETREGEHRQPDQHTAGVAQRHSSQAEAGLNEGRDPDDRRERDQDVEDPDRGAAARHRRLRRRSSRTPDDNERESREPERGEARKEVALRTPPGPRDRSPEAVQDPRRQEVARTPGVEEHLAQGAAHPVQPLGAAVREGEWQKRHPTGGGGADRGEHARAALPALLDREESEREEEEESREERVVHVRESVPREADAEEDEVPPPAGVEIPQQEEQQQAEKSAPLMLQMRHLREPPRHERIDEARDDRGERISGDEPGERPGREGGRKDPGEEERVVVEKRRGAASEQRPPEHRDAPQVLGERQNVVRRVEEVELEEMPGVVQGLVVVPLQDAGVELGVPDVRHRVAQADRLRPGHQDGGGEEEEGRERGLASGTGGAAASGAHRCRARTLFAIVWACWRRCMRRWRFCVASTSPVGGHGAADLAQQLLELEAERLEVGGLELLEGQLGGDDVAIRDVAHHRVRGPSDEGAHPCEKCTSAEVWTTRASGIRSPPFRGGHPWRPEPTTSTSTPC